jgi:DNA-binding NtrC family response regulator
MPGRILVVDDEQSMCDLLAEELSTRGFEVACHTSAPGAFTELKRTEFDVVLTDLNMPGLTGLELCERIVENRPDVLVVVITAFGSMEAAISAIRAGAYDFVTKPVDMEMLALTLERAMQRRRLEEKVRVLSEALDRSRPFEDLIGESPAMHRLFDDLARMARSEASVLITGETGTGKELVAKAIHERGPRRRGPFVPLDCAAMPETLLESELFGHRRGAFTDARSSREGLFQTAHGGTLFLDEVGEIPVAVQPKLLRALETGTVRPIGADEEVNVDVRFIAATNRDLESAIEEDRFREDLYYRINVLQVDLPPLRSRGTDVLLIAQRFIERMAESAGKPVTGMTRPVAERLLSYSWPGNVRELRNIIERAVALTQCDQIVVEDLPEKIRSYSGSPVLATGSDPSELRSLDSIERAYVQHVLKAVGGNKSRAARILGLDRKTLYRWLDRYDQDAAG